MQANGSYKNNFGAGVSVKTARVVRRRLIIVTPFFIPLSRRVEFDRALLTTTIAREGSWRVRSLRWRASSSIGLYQPLQKQAQIFIQACQHHQVLAEMEIASDRVRIVWPRWNQVSGIGKWRDDRDEVLAMLERHAVSVGEAC